jgi:hypothetical protein
MQSQFGFFDPLEENGACHFLVSYSRKAIFSGIFNNGKGGSGFFVSFIKAIGFHLGRQRHDPAISPLDSVQLKWGVISASPSLGFL